MRNIRQLGRNNSEGNSILKQVKMMLLLFGIILLGLKGHSQAVVTSTTIEKENRNAVMIQIDQPVDLTTEALEQRLEHSGISGKTSKGVTLYKGVTFPEISAGVIDIYTKVEKGSNNEKSTVYMAVSKGYDNFTNTVSDNLIIENIKAFLNSFVRDANYFSAEIEISAKIEEIAKAQSAYESLLSDQKDLESKKADIESRLVEKQKEINEKKSEVEYKKSELDELKNKRAANK